MRLIKSILDPFLEEEELLEEEIFLHTSFFMLS
jgi:hypothetical protein